MPTAGTSGCGLAEDGRVGVLRATVRSRVLGGGEEAHDGAQVRPPRPEHVVVKLYHLKQSGEKQRRIQLLKVVPSWPEEIVGCASSTLSPTKHSNTHLGGLFGVEDLAQARDVVIVVPPRAVAHQLGFGRLPRAELVPEVAGGRDGLLHGRHRRLNVKLGLQARMPYVAVKHKAAKIEARVSTQHRRRARAARTLARVAPGLMPS